ncbi:MAG TPA: alpha-ketoglutarate-dependent dioxygenase AlkB [Blastocatellia bacterium]|nr:alpha-ketoglutarate-dependent dioxygenase AlkB [Blastocatellia bacterium]
MLHRLSYDTLDDRSQFWTSSLPDRLLPDDDSFGELWDLHPPEFHEIRMHGRLVKTPRWQQAYGADYHYAGKVNRALPVPAQLEALHSWVRGNIDCRLNGLLLNWYDGRLGHYIGRHRDSIRGMLKGAPIITVSFGEARIFRLRPWKKAGRRDFMAEHGSVFVMPWETNLAWTHEVPHYRKYRGRRISVTLRAFEATPLKHP